MRGEDTFTSFLSDVFSESRKVAESTEVFGVWSDETQIRFEANHFKEIQGKRSNLVALRLIKNGRIGFAQASGITDPSVIVNMALETAPLGAVAQLEFPGTQKYPDILVFDLEMSKVTFEEMVELGAQLIDRVRKRAPSLLCDATISKSSAKVCILNSTGGDVQYRKSISRVSLEGVLVQGEDMLFVGDGVSSCHPMDNSDTVAQVIEWQLEMAESQASMFSGTLPVIFTPRGVASTLAMPLAVGFSGKTVLQGASPLKENLGEKIFDSKLCLRDDATAAFRPESRPSDDEGIPSQNTALIEQGIVKAFYYDLQTAGSANAKSTGNGSRGRGGLPSPGVSCLVFQEGATSFSEMVSEMRNGLVVEHLMGAEQGNLLGGEFSGNVLLGFKVEDGEIVGRVKDVMVSGNVYQALNNIVAMGRESRWIGGTVKCPHVWLEGLAVAAKA